MNIRTLPSPFRFLLNRHDDPQPPANPTPPAPTPPAPGPAADPAGKTDPADPDDEPLRPEGVKALAEWKQRAKEAEAAAKTAADRVREFEDRDKTELERA